MKKPSKNKLPDRRELRPVFIHAEKQVKTFVLGQNEIYELNKKVIDFTAPNNIAICLNISNREYEIALQKFLKLISPKFNNKSTRITFDETEISELYDYFEHLQISLLFAYTAVEAFGNIAIPENYTFEKFNNKKVKEIWTKESIERWLSTSEKIGEILPAILGVEPPFNEAFWPQFKKLEQIRNEIIHQKTVNDKRNVSSKYLHEFFSRDIFDIIRAGFLLIEYFCSKVEYALIYFPLGVGTPKQQIVVIDDFEKYFASINDHEEK